MRKSKLQAALEQHFAVGNIILSNYWRKHDEVLAFDWNNGAWRVTVQHVIPEGGQWVRTERARNHCTHPDKRDRIVASLVTA